MSEIAHWGRKGILRESSLKVDSGREKEKKSLATSGTRTLVSIVQWFFSRTLYQLSCPRPWIIYESSVNTTGKLIFLLVRRCETIHFVPDVRQCNLFRSCAEKRLIPVRLLQLSLTLLLERGEIPCPLALQRNVWGLGVYDDAKRFRGPLRSQVWFRDMLGPDGGWHIVLLLLKEQLVHNYQFPLVC